MAENSGDFTDNIDGDQQNVLGANDQLIQYLADPVYVINEENILTFVNDAFMKATGYEQENLIGRHVEDILLYVNETEDITDSSPSYPDESETERFEAKLLTSDGSMRFVEVHNTLVTAESSFNGETIGIVRDISKRKRQEQDLELVTQVLTRFLRHNVRNDITIIVGNTEYLDRRVTGDLGDYTATILQTCDRLANNGQKARELITLAGTDEREQIDIKRTVEKTIVDLRQQYPTADIRVDIPDETHVKTHYGIQKAIEEIAENALEHAPADEQPSLDIWIEHRDQSTTLFFEDTSGGLDEYEIDVLRQGAETEFKHIRGLGLWIVWLVVDSSTAELTLQQTGEGTMIGLRFTEPEKPPAENYLSYKKSPVVENAVSPQDTPTQQVNGDTTVDRTTALRQLEAAYQDIKQTGGHTVVISGEMGIGKTTAIEQFREVLEDKEESPLIARGACDADTQPLYHGFQGVFSTLPFEDSIPERLTSQPTPSTEDADVVQKHKRGLFSTVVEELREIVSDQPVIIIVEDLHWADEGTIDLFEYLVDQIGRWGPPILFVGTYRTTDVDETHPVVDITEDLSESGRGTALELTPLSRDEVEALLSQMLSLPDVTGEVVDTIYEQTGGLPLFVAELGRHILAQHDALYTADDVLDAVSEITLPESVETLVTERLASLPEQEQQILELGAVSGMTISFDVLRRASDVPDNRLIDAIDELVRRRVWRREKGTIEFIHGILREETREKIPHERRIQLEQRVASAIEAVYETNIEPQAARLGRHYEHAQEYDCACEYYQIAGERAIEAHSYEEAERMYTRALSLARAHDVGTPAELASIHAGRVESKRIIGDTDGAEASIRTGLSLAPDESEVASRLLGLGAKLNRSRGDFTLAHERADQQRNLAEKLDIQEHQVAATAQLGDIATAQSKYDHAKTHYEEALTGARELQDYNTEVHCLNGLGSIAQSKGQNNEARDLFEEGLSLSRQLNDKRGEANTLNNLGITAWQQGKYETAEEYFEQNLEISQQIGDRRGESKGLNNLGLIAQVRGDLEEANQYYRQSLAIDREIGDQDSEAQALHNLAEVAMDRGNPDSARTYYEQGLEIRRTIGDQQGEASCLNGLGVIEFIHGNYEQAREFFTQSLEIRQEIGDQRKEAASHANLGEILMRRGEYEQARQSFQRALAMARETENQSTVSSCLENIGTVSMYQGEYDQADEYLTQSLELAEELAMPRQQAITLRKRGMVATRRGNEELARGYFDQSLALFEENEGTKLEQAKTYRAQAQFALSCDEFTTAQAAVEDSEALLADRQVPCEEAYLNLISGRIACATNQYETAREYGEQAFEIFERLDLQREMLDALQFLIEECPTADETVVQEWVHKAHSTMERCPQPVASKYDKWLKDCE